MIWDDDATTVARVEFGSLTKKGKGEEAVKGERYQCGVD